MLDLYSKEQALFGRFAKIDSIYPAFQKLSFVPVLENPYCLDNDCASMFEHHGLDVKIYTIEDPVEKLIPNASQINVSADADDAEDLSEKYILYQKNILRQDPDDIMIGEVRDLSVAETALHVATTGHMALATIHTNGALPIIMRLHDIGISWQKLSSPGLLRALSYQRLTPCLCENCKITLATMPDSHPYRQNRKLASARVRIDQYMQDFIQQCNSDQLDCTPYVANPDGCSHVMVALTGAPC